ncbi:MAG: hypothetical protein [Caudoviricetes sp.]|nr:MAG: hypothetical protein [Caudoviricetes sp.]
MRTYSPRVTRLVKSYAPVKNALTVALGIDKVQQTPIMVYCEVKKQLLPADEFYVKKYRQEKDPKNLYLNDYRHISKEIWDQRVANQRKGLGWKSDEELLESNNNIEQFLSEEENQ